MSTPSAVLLYRTKVSICRENVTRRFAHVALILRENRHITKRTGRFILIQLDPTARENFIRIKSVRVEQDKCADTYPILDMLIVLIFKCESSSLQHKTHVHTYIFHFESLNIRIQRAKRQECLGLAGASARNWYFYLTAILPAYFRILQLHFTRSNGITDLVDTSASWKHHSWCKTRREIR